MKNPPVVDIDGMRDLFGSWGIALRAQRRSHWTISQYERGARLWLDWCEANGARPDLADPGPVRRWLAEIAATGVSPYTINARLSAIRAWARWLEEQDEIPGHALSKVGWAKPDERIPPYITPDQQAAIVRSCAGVRWLDLRDAAMFSVMFDGLLRADDAVSLAAVDIDARKRTVRVRRGKGGKERWTTFSPETAARVDRYARARRKNRFAALDQFFLSQKGPLSYSGLYGAFKRRAELAGIEAHPHMLRAGGAVQWRRKGGSVTGLMTVAGWSSVAMVDLYTRAASSELAIAEAHRLHEGRLDDVPAEPGPELDQAAAFEHRHGVPDRAAADAELASDQADIQPPAVLELAAADPCSDHLSSAHVEPRVVHARHRTHA